jgi:histidyl-tRNA synthetase
VCAGGRYDGLIEMLGGPKIPGIGFAMGIERLVLLLKQQGDQSEKIDEIDLFIAGLGEEAADYSFKLMHELRTQGLRVDMDLDGKSLKSQMKKADRAGARYALIVGSQELADKQAPLRDMKTGEQTELDLDSIASFFTDAEDS